MYKVYRIKNNINGKFYIGYTKLSLNKRWKLHINSGSNRMPIYRAIQKYGHENFTITLLEDFDTKQDAVKREIELIAELKPCYNAHQGVTGGPMYGSMNGMFGKTHSKEWKEKKRADMLGEKNYMYGKTHSDEVKKKLSEMKKGTKSLNKGVPMTEQQKEKLRVPKTEEHKQKLRLTYNVDGIIVDNAKQYCVEHGHNYIRFTQAAKKCKMYKGLSVKVEA
jgi:group I intron endonuclease